MFENFRHFWVIATHPSWDPLKLDGVYTRDWVLVYVLKMKNISSIFWDILGM